MAPVDPSVLLNTIVYLLESNGGLKNDRVVRQFITLMKLTEKLVNKAIYLQILNHTKSEDVLKTEYKINNHIYPIFHISSVDHNHAFLLDTLNIIGNLPFNIDNVSQNDIDELQLKIAELTSAESGKEKDIRESARHLYELCTTKGLFQTIDTHPDIDQPASSQSSSISRLSTSIDKHQLTSQRLNKTERTLLSSNNNTFPFNDSKMATTATLTAVSGTNTNNNSNNTDNIKRKTEENIGPTTNRKPTHRRLVTQPQVDTKKMKSSIEIDDSDGLNKTNLVNRTTPTFRIPKIGRSNTSAPSPPSETNESSPPPTSTAVQPTKINASMNRQTSDELNAQQGKRKFSLSQYIERKRLKSNELQSTLADTDMRINNIGNSKASPPMPIDDDSSNNIPENPPVISPKPDETNTVIKSNLSEPGVKKVNKKKVIWADEKSQTLVHTSFFEVDDSELSAMHVYARTCAANISIAQLEKVMERDLRKRRGIQDMNAMDNDDKQILAPLPAFIKILLPDTIQIPPVISQERFVQEEREKTVLQALFIRSFLPDSPGEPDGDLIGQSHTERTEPKLIPLEDDASSSLSSTVTSVNSNNTTTTTAATAATNIPIISINNSMATSTTTAATTTTTTTTTTPNNNNNTVTPSLSSFSFGDVSPEVAQILAQAKGNLTSATANNLSTTIASNTLLNLPTTLATATSTITNTTAASTPNLPPPPTLLSALLNATRTANNETTNGKRTLESPPPNSMVNMLPNLSLNFNLPPPPTPFPLSQLIANALTLGIPPPPTANPNIFQTQSTTFTTPPPNMSNSIANSIQQQAVNSKQPSVRFVSAIGQQQTRPNLSNNNIINNHNNNHNNNNNNNNNHEHQISSSRENSREHNFRRGPPNNNRRDYYQNRNNNNNNNTNNNNNHNNNRNIFS
ncbi:unnamed protein product [Rotaria socialis]|uniref:Uncharacterized protein n=1 Tax=Rotaria socialis TaxID=392032 RepID=A0A821JJK7_9BILA|nr:unnamed protein product [Rotaria socialis]